MILKESNQTICNRHPKLVFLITPTRMITGETLWFERVYRFVHGHNGKDHGISFDHAKKYKDIPENKINIII